MVIITTNIAVTKPTAKLCSNPTSPRRKSTYENIPILSAKKYIYPFYTKDVLYTKIELTLSNQKKENGALRPNL
jgi:hypothetical protein